MNKELLEAEIGRLGVEHESVKTRMIQANADEERTEREARTARTVLDNVCQEKRHLLAKTRVIRHILAGKCAAAVSSVGTWSRYENPCAKNAKADCPSCGGPFCGTHGKVSRTGFYPHSCASWTAFVKGLGIAEKEEVQA